MLIPCGVLQKIITSLNGLGSCYPPQPSRNGVVTVARKKIEPGRGSITAKRKQKEKRKKAATKMKI